MSIWQIGAGSKLVTGGILIILSVCGVACDTIKPSSERITGDETLAPFNLEMVELEPLELDVDTNRLRYRYKARTADAAVLQQIDDRALRSGWSSQYAAEHERTYSKTVRFNDAYDHERVIIVRVADQGGTVEITSMIKKWVKRR